MSAALVEGFFPESVHMARSHGHGQAVWDFLFPRAVQVRCPCPEPPPLFWFGPGVGYVPLRWPVASAFCLLGVFVGFAYGTPLLHRAATVRKPAGCFNDSFAWGSAFLWYGLMSVGGLLYHCLFPRLALAYHLDILSTACCCFSIISACLCRGRPSFLASCQALAACLVLSGPQIAREMLYLVPSLAATAAGITAGTSEWRAAPSSAKPWLCAAALALAVATAPVLADRWLCGSLGPNFSLIFWFFLGSDFALVFLYEFLIRARKRPESRCKSM